MSEKSLNLQGSLLKGEEIIIHGGYQHPEKGRFVEKSPASEPSIRNSVSIWELTFPDYETADLIFTTVFGLTPEESLKRDLRKGVAAALNIKVTSLEEFSEDDLITEENPETILMSQEENPVDEEEIISDNYFPGNLNYATA